MAKRYCVSISRQFGSLGRPIAKRLARELGIKCYDRDIVELAAERQGITIEEASSIEERASKYGTMRFPLGTGTSDAQDKIFAIESQIIREIADRESCIIVGRCSESILEAYENHISVFICAPYEQRVVNCVNELGMDPQEARRMIASVDKARDAYHMHYVRHLPYDTNYVDLMLNSALFGVEGSASFLADVVRRKLPFADQCAGGLPAASDEARERS